MQRTCGTARLYNLSHSRCASTRTRCLATCWLHNDGNQIYVCGPNLRTILSLKKLGKNSSALHRRVLLVHVCTRYAREGQTPHIRSKTHRKRSNQRRVFSYSSRPSTHASSKSVMHFVWATTGTNQATGWMRIGKVINKERQAERATIKRTQREQNEGLVLSPCRCRLSPSTENCCV